MRRTSIIATLGPASDGDDGIERLIRAGVDVFRLNFSHDTHEGHRARIARIHAAEKRTGRRVGVLQDLCGPKIRTGKMREGGVRLESGAEVVVTTEPCVGTPERFSTQYRKLAEDIEPGKRILLDDGSIILTVAAVDGNDIRCEVVVGGLLKSNKGMNLPDTAVSAPSVTRKDLRDLKVGIEADVDFVALSFVRGPDDIRTVKKKLRDAGAEAWTVAKIERPEGVENIDDIIAVADAIMVARGDLGVEMDVARVPVIQKDIIRRCNEQDTPVITATQMLESMTHSPSPTRAEVSDVANAILDGSDAVMLSGETAAGEYPERAVRMMDTVARTAEAPDAESFRVWDWTRINPRHPVADSIGQAARILADGVDAKLVIAASQSGGTALFLSKSRPTAPVLAFSTSEKAVRWMRLLWGVEPVYAPQVKDPAGLRKAARETIRAGAWAETGDTVLIVAGSHFGQVGASNAIEVAVVGESLGACRT